MRVLPTFSPAWGGMILGSAQIGPTKGIKARDAIIAAEWRPLRGSTTTATVRLGASIPTGAIGAGPVFTPLSTQSLDPWIAGSVVYGSKVLGVASGQARVPLYAGPDGVTQGTFLRGDLRAAVRIPKAVLYAGLSAAGGLPDSNGMADFYELAPIAGGVWNLHERWALAGSLRWQAVADHQSYGAAGIVSLRHVVFTGKKPVDDHH